MNVISVLLFAYLYYPGFTTYTFIVYFLLQLILQIALARRWTEGNAIEPDFLKLRNAAVKSYIDSRKEEDDEAPQSRRGGAIS